MEAASLTETPSGSAAGTTYVPGMEAAQLIAFSGNPFGDKLLAKVERVAEVTDLSTSQVYEMAKDGGPFAAVPVSDGKRPGKRIVVASVIQWIINGGTMRADRPSAAERAANGSRRRAGLKKVS